MNNPPNTLSKELAAEIDRLSAGFQRGELTPAESERLDALLLENPAARQRYIRGLAMIGALEWNGGAPVAETDGDQQPSQSPWLPSGISDASTWSSYSWVIGFALSALVACFIVYRLWQNGTQDEHVVSAAPQETHLAAVKHIKLDSGSVKLQVDKVGTVTVTGPADFEILGPMRAKLNSGKIRMRVTEETGRGFVVETPDGDITDLGTEFGVEVGQGRRSALAVFEGSVDLQIAGQSTEKPHIERLLGGDGVLFNKGGKTDRLNSIMTGEGAKFHFCGVTSAISFDDPIIVRVYDNLPPQSTKRYYEIVPGGMAEDALAFVDRLEHNWNGMSKDWGMPRFLRSGDYVKTFCDDKVRTDIGFELTVVLSRAAVLYVFMDRRLEAPDWLRQSFELLPHRIGLDRGKGVSSSDNRPVGIGPGDSIDCEFDIWKQVVRKPGAVKLGPNGKVAGGRAKHQTNMYGVVAVELPPKAVKKPSPANQAKRDRSFIEK